MLPQKRDHHYVPEMLLKPWLVVGHKGNNVLLAYSWNERSKSVHCKDNLGTNGYCYRKDLLALAQHPDGRDFLEAKFFEHVDNEGARVLAHILRNGLQGLTDKQRNDFAYLLLSLEARRPQVLERLRGEGVESLRQKLDDDEEITELLKREGINSTPSEYYEKHVSKLADRALLAVLPFLTKESIGLQSLANCHWLVRKITPGSPRLVLSDRPLIRIGSATDPDRIWCLPLSPTVLFFASPNKRSINTILRKSDKQVVLSTNVESVRQRDRYVFSVDRDSGNWLAKLMSQ